MRAFARLSVGIFGAAMLAAPAQSASLVPVVPVKHSTATTVYGINDANTIAGGFIGKDGVEHAFFGTLDGQYKTFDAGTGGTEARAINNNGYITGFSNSQTGSTAEQAMFERHPHGRIENIFVQGQQLFGRAQGINNARNVFAGTYWNFSNHEAVAFIGHRGQGKHEVRIPAVHQASEGGGINSAGVVVGSFFQPPQQGYVVSGRTLTVVNYPSDSASSTTLEGINDNGQAVGQWVDGDGNTHSFLYDIATNAFTDIDVSGATNVYASNINSAGAVAVNSDAGSFIWCASDSACPTGGKKVAAPVHVPLTPLQQYPCDSSCTRPIGQARH